MKTNRSAYLASLMAMGLMFSADPANARIDTSSPTSFSGTKFKGRPKGTKEYSFTTDGICDTERQDNQYYVYTCYALNEKNAIKKYKSWKNLKH
jgi:hypothetical protein